MKPDHRTPPKSGIKFDEAQFVLKKHLLISLLFCLPFAAQAGLEGVLETANCSSIKGWAYDPANFGTRLKLDIIDTSTSTPTKITTVTAQLLRQDLLAAGKGDGKYGFFYLLPASIRNAKLHVFAVRLSGTGTELASSPQTTAACYGKLNDTGIKTCSDGTTNGLPCPVTGFPGQDGDYGRDAQKSLRKIGKGSAGFDFTKIANNGSVLPTTAVLGSGPKDWACTRDNITGLVWEVKTDDEGLRDKDNTYSWYNKTNGGGDGFQNRGYCTGGITGDISCDTYAYANKVNHLTMCGKADWRLPKQAELQSIVDYSRVGPAIDTDYFPNTPSRMFWSSSPDAFNRGAWIVNFIAGWGGQAGKSIGNAVRLVRAGQ